MSPTIWQKSVCAAAGALVGAVAGLVFELGRLPLGSLSTSDVVQVGLILGFAGWLAALIVIGLWLHIGIAVMAWRSFFTAIITGVLTILVLNKTPYHILFVWIGILIGTLVGWLLCLLCRKIVPTRENNNAMS
jgi:hypothetical protein